jgi:tetratricopeptide (TPR) repeat protein
MKKRLHLLLPTLLLALVGLGGCSRDDSQFLSSEADDSDFRQGQQLERQGSPKQALTAFLKVIAKRHDDAPESHLEAGLICAQHMKNPIEAIYHFNKYLELQPNSRQAELVRQRIDAAKRDFARTLPAQPLESAADRLEMQDQLAHLLRENDQLKAELLALQGGSPAPMRAASSDDGGALVRPPVLVSQPASPPESDSPLSLAPETPVPAARSPAVRPVTARSNATKPTAPTSSARKHTVQVGESLYKIATHYYGSAGASAKVQVIFEANRDVMKNISDLKPGMELKIP